MQSVNYRILRWAAAIYCLVIGAMMLVVPHQFSTPTDDVFQPRPDLWAVLFLTGGIALLLVAVFNPSRPMTVAVHLFAGLLLLIAGYEFAQVQAWNGAANHVTLGLGILLAPLLFSRSGQEASVRDDLFGLVMSIVAILNGLVCLLLPDLTAPLRHLLPGFGMAFMVSGLVLAATVLSPAGSGAVQKGAPILLGLVFLLWLSQTSASSPAWVGVAWYGSFGILLICSPWLRVRLGGSSSITEIARLSTALEHIQTRLVERTAERDQVVRTLHDERERLLVTLSRIGDAAISTDDQGVVTFLNPMAERLTGWSQAEALGQDVQRVFHIVNEMTRQLVENPITRVLAEGIVVGLANHAVLIAKDGQEYSIDESGAPIRDAEGQLIGGILVFRDMSAPRRAEIQRRAYEEEVQQILDSVPVLIASLDTEERYRFSNQALAASYGHTPGELRGKRVQDIVNETAYRRAKPYLETALSGQAVTFENFVPVSDGSLHTNLVHYVPGFGEQGQVTGLIVAASDITELKQAERTLQEQLAEIASIYNTAPVGLAVLDRDLRYVRLNEPLAAMNGFPAAQHLGRTIRDMVPLVADLIEPKLRRILDTGEPVLDIELQGETAAQPGVRRDWVESWVPLKTPDGQVIGLSAVIQEVTERKRDERFTRLLYNLTSALSGAPTADAIAQALSEQIRPALGASFALIGLLTADKRHLDLLNVPERFSDFRQQYARMSMDDPLPMSDVARTGHSLYFESQAAYLAQYPTLADVLQQVNVEATIFVPLVVNDQITGVLRVGFDQPRRIDQKELDFWTILASSCAQALERARLYEEAEDARRYAEQLADRATRLQTVTARLSEALTPAEVAQVVVDQGVAALGAKTGAVYLLDKNRTALEVRAANGYAPETLQAAQRFSLDTPLPLGDAVKSGRPIWLETLDAYFAQYPFARTIPRLNQGARAIIPFQIKDQAVGTVVLGFSQDRSFTDDDKQFMRTLADLSAQALERARLYDAEHQSHLEAETARQRFRTLADTSMLLATSLDYETTLINLEGILLPAFADYYAVDLVENEENEQLRRVVASATDTAVLEAIDEINHRFPLDPNGAFIRKALRLGQSHWLPEITPEMLDQAATTPEHAALMHQMRTISSINLPLVVRSKVIGVLSVGMSTSGRHYSAEDVSLGEELARRIAQAIDNARLYEKAQMNAEALRQQVAEQTQELHYAVERAQAADRAKTSMLSNVTHEMRTPLSSIVGFSNLMTTRALSGEKQREFIKAINQEGRRLTRLIENFLDLQRIEAGRQTFSFGRVDLAALVQEEVDQLELVNELLPPIRIECEPAALVSADTEALRRVIRNLLANALKFSPEDEILLSVRSNDHDVLFSIRDHGIGIRAEELGHLFQRFYRSEMADQQRIQGTGLGLALCREIIAAHRGRIWAESAGEGQGATFHFTLPAAS